MSFFTENDAAGAGRANDLPAERLVSEPVVPVAGSFLAASMAAGTPGVPTAFSWRGKEYRVTALLGERKTFRGCRNGSGEKYVDKHLFRVETDTGEVMNLYRARTGSKGDRWILYTIERKTEGA